MHSCIHSCSAGVDAYFQRFLIHAWYPIQGVLDSYAFHKSLKWLQSDHVIDIRYVLVAYSNKKDGPLTRDGISFIFYQYLIFLLQQISDISVPPPQPISDILYWQILTNIDIYIGICNIGISPLFLTSAFGKHFPMIIIWKHRNYRHIGKYCHTGTSLL